MFCQTCLGRCLPLFSCDFLDPPGRFEVSLAVTEVPAIDGPLGGWRGDCVVEFTPVLFVPPKNKGAESRCCSISESVLGPGCVTNGRSAG